MDRFVMFYKEEQMHVLIINLLNSDVVNILYSEDVYAQKSELVFTLYSEVVYVTNTEKGTKNKLKKNIAGHIFPEHFNKHLSLTPY
jgi:hypothetical protein